MDGWCYVTATMIDELISYMPELHEAIYEQGSKSNEPSSGAKPKSRPPLNIDALDLHEASTYEIDAHKWNVIHECRLARTLDSVRRLLGYDVPMIKLASTSCHVCEGTLTVAADASTDVMCMTEGCGTVYAQADWIEILYAA